MDFSEYVHKVWLIDHDTLNIIMNMIREDPDNVSLFYDRIRNGGLYIGYMNNENPDKRVKMIQDILYGLSVTDPRYDNEWNEWIVYNIRLLPRYEYKWEENPYK